MKKIFKFFPIALAAIAVVSCNNEDELFSEIQSDAQSKNNAKTLQVTVAEAVTDANATRAAYYNGNKITWQAGDAFRVYDAQLQKYDEYKYDGENSKFATLDKNVISPAYSLFPAELVSYSGWKNDVGLYAVYDLKKELSYSESIKTVDENDYIAYESNIPMFGEILKGSSADELKAQYVYLTGALKIRLYNGESKVKSIKVESLKDGSAKNTDMPLSGYFNAVLDGEGNFKTDVNKSMLVKSDEAIVADSYDTEISVKVDDFIKNQESYVYIPIVPGIYPKLKISYVDGDDADVELATLVNKEIKAGHFYAKNDAKEIMEIVNTADVDVPDQIVPEDLTKILAANTDKEGTVNFNIVRMRVNNAAYVDRYTVYVPKMNAKKVVLNFTKLDNTVDPFTNKLRFIDADEEDPYDGELEIKVGTLAETKAVPVEINLPSTSVQFVGDFVPTNAAAITITDVKKVTFGEEEGTATKIGDLTLTKVAEEINVMEGAELTKEIALPETVSAAFKLNIGGTTKAIAAKKATTNVIGAGYITTLRTWGDVNVEVEKFPGAAIANLIMVGNNPTLDLKCGYIKTLTSTDATAEAPRTINIKNEETGVTAIQSLGTPSNVTFTFGTSKWAGKVAKLYNNQKSIYTASQLASVAGSLDGGYKLENNIDLNNSDWTAIASLTVEFDGNKKTISNLKGKQGLFSAISADVKNLTLDKFTISPDAEVAGAVAGTVSGAATLTDITVTGLTITGAGANGCKLGGLVGTNSAKLTIAGASVAGQINAYSNLGGFLGYAGADVDIKKSSTEGSTVASTVSFTANYDSGEAYDPSYAKVGRFIGSADKSATIIIADAETITAPSINTTKFNGEIQQVIMNGDKATGYDIKFPTQRAIGYCGTTSNYTAESKVTIATNKYKAYDTEAAGTAEGLNGTTNKEFALYYINK